MTYFLRLVTAPAVEPVTLEEAKEQCQQDGSADNALLTRLIKAARSYIEQETGRALITQTWEAVFGEWPKEDIGTEQDYSSAPTYFESVAPRAAYASFLTIVKAPFIAVTEITAAGSAWTAYTATRTVRGVKITPTSGVPAGEVVVTFTAGYGATAATVPSDLSHALLMMVATLYDNRGSLAFTPKDKDIAIAAANTPGCMDAIHRYRVMS